MEMVKQKDTLKNVVAVLVGALLMGFLWRVRGDTGWGSSWGLLNAGFVFTMFIVLVNGERKKLDMSWLTITSLSFMLTVPAWGTLLNQITGVLHRPTDFGVVNEVVYTSVCSAVLIMLSLGFGLATVFGIMLGRGYSDKQWKVKDFIILIAVFYITDLVTKATVSHFILNLIQPEAVDLFSKGLAAEGIEGDVWKVYLQHFDNVSWGKKFEGGRNYFSTIQVISSVFRSAASLIATRFIIKDKISAKVGFIVSSAFAFSITVSDLFFWFGNGGYHMQGESAFTDFIYPWSCWEYFTGFIAGAIITAFILSMKKTDDVPELAFAKVPEKPTSVLQFVLGFVFMIGVSIVRPVLERFDDSPYQIIATVIAVLFAIAFVVLLNVKFGFNAQKITVSKLYGILLPFFVAYICIAYFVIGAENEINIYSIGSLHNILCVCSAVLTLAGTVLLRKNNT